MNSRLEMLADELQNPGHVYTAKFVEDGISGTYFILDNKKPIAVYKDASEDPLSPNNPKTTSQVRQLFLPAADYCVRFFGYPTGSADLLDDTFTNLNNTSSAKKYRSLYEESHLPSMSFGR